MNTQKDSSRSRHSAFELCRILAMLMIVGFHFSDYSAFSFDSNVISVPRLWWHILKMGGGFGVDVFVLISGYFLIHDTSFTINKRKVCRLWGQAFFYSAVIFLFGYFSGITNGSILQAVKAIFPITTKAWWFLTNYFVLFLLHLCLNRLLHSLNKRQYQSVLLMLLFIWCIIPTFTSYPFASNELLFFIMLYSAAGYIRLFGFYNKLKSRHFLILWLLSSLVTLLSSVAFMVLGKKISFLADHTLFFYSRNSLLTILRAISFFMTFERMKLPAIKIINTISSAAFGVYLIHDSHIIRPWLWKSVFKSAPFQDSLMLIPYSIGVTIIVYLVCTFIDLIRIHTAERLYMPLMDRCINYLAAPLKRISGILTQIVFGKENA